MKISVILVEPEYEKNIGYVCRVMKNFGYKNLIILNPKCKIGKDAVKYSKHGVGILKKAKRVKSFEKQIKEYDFVIGTSAIKKRNKDAVRNIVPLRELSKNSGQYKGKKVLLVIGREGIGLRAKEINLCDVLVTIETGGNYPTLNISHALGILLYELKGSRTRAVEPGINKKEKQTLIKMFSKLAEKKAKNTALAIASFRRMLGRSRIKKKEAQMLMDVLGKCE